MALSKYTTSNIANSLSVLLATKALEAGFVVYWHHRDAVQTADGFYYEYSANRATYLNDQTFQDAYAAAVGMLTITDNIPANPQHIVRPITDGSVGPAETVTVPVLSVEVAPMVPIQNWELGSTLKLRYRHLVLDALARTKDEAARIADLLAETMDQDVTVDVLDHDAGTLATVGTIRVASVRVDRANWLEEPEERRFEVLLNAQLEYVA